MNLSTRIRPLTALIMSLVVTITSLPIGMAQAGMVSTETMIEQETSAATAFERGPSDHDRIRALLGRDDVRTQMMSLGIEPAEAEARVRSLTDQEIADIAGRLDQLPAGEGIGTILIILFIVFGVSVLLDALGMMDIYPFVCGPGQCGGATQVYSQETYNPPPPPTDAYRSDRRLRAYPRDQFEDRNYRQAPPPQTYQQDPYYQPQPRTRNYYEERFGAQRYVR